MAVFKRLISPVFGKEMTQFAASRRNFVLKCVFLALTFAIIALTAVSAEFQTGKFLCSAASIIGLVTAFFAVPIMTAGIVSAEVEANTLHLLFLTNLTPWNIAQDKALSRVAQMSYLLTLLLPIYACGMLFGGITWLRVPVAR